MICIILVSFFFLLSCRPEEKSAFRCAFYNTENFFDTACNPGKDDQAFTPDGENGWNEEKYEHKLENIARVVRDLGENGEIGLLGLAEIENRKVLEDLLEQPALWASGYGIVHAESFDPRGIDVALLYSKRLFVSIASRLLQPDHPGRGILYVKGIARQKDTLHVFVNHWPSRVTGQKASEPRRLAMAGLLISRLDSLEALPWETKIIVMGDFNDAPYDKSIQKLKRLPYLRSHADAVSTVSCYYKGKGYAFDQIFSNFLSGPLTVFRPAYLTDKNGISPLRTFQGPIYRGGYSDHFPVFVDF